MGFDVLGPTGRVRASNVDDGAEPTFDVLALPGRLGANCPTIETLHRRFYDSTTLRFGVGEVFAFRDDLIRLRAAYRAVLEPELVRKRGIRARDPAVRDQAVEQVLLTDPTYRAIEDLVRLCDDALAAEADIRCEGD